MNRREAIHRAGLMLGTAVSYSVAAAVLQGCKPSYDIDWQPVFLNSEQAHLVGEIAETILPETDSPGAKSLHVDEFIDLMLQEAYTREEQQQFIQGLEALTRKCLADTGKDFVTLPPADRLQFLLSEEEALKTEAGHPVLSQLKELTLVGYFTSEYAGTQVLNFKPVPGHYHGCVDYDGGPAQIGMRI